MSESTPDNRPTEIGKYHIIECVGEGAMGVVYRAVDSVLDRTVAIKVMSASIAQQQDLRQRFLREAQAAGSLQHPNVVTIFDHGEVDGHLFIAMEFVHGVDLERLIELHEPLSLQAKLDIIIDVLTGLFYAHKRGIVHRDIKPANIRVGEDGRAKIMDFGVAHLASSNMTRTGLVLGTPSYMAPEQVTGGKATGATDIFAVGAVLYQLLTGSKPFDARTLQSLFYKIVSEMPRPISEAFPGLPPALNRIVMKALAKDPLARYANALDMASELGRVRSELSGAPYPASLSLGEPIASGIDHGVIVKEPSGRRSRIIAGGVAILIAASLLVWIALGQNSSTPVAMGNSADTVVAANTGGDSIVLSPMESRAPPTVRPNAPSIQSSIAAPGERERAAVSQVIPPSTRPLIGPVPGETAAPRPSTPSTADIAPVVAAYARAIESRDIGSIRRVYPGLTGDQQRGFEQFFQSARNINVTFRVVNAEATGASADARLVGSYEYFTTSGKAERQPVSFAAALRHDGSVWRLVSVR